MVTHPFEYSPPRLKETIAHYKDITKAKKPTYLKSQTQIDILEHSPLHLKSRAPIWYAETQNESVEYLWMRRWEQSETRNRDLIK
jgi:hypothetical protein